MSYNKYSVQGFLKKRVNEVKFLQKSSVYKRYFTLDHNSKKMRVHQTNDPNSEYKMFEYVEIQAMNLPIGNLQNKMTIQERWSFEFSLVTKRRVYMLYAASMDERNLWIHTFSWILARNHYLNNSSLIISQMITPKHNELQIIGKDILNKKL